MIDRYAVMGNPIEHSLSPRIHRAFADQTQQRLNYERLLVPLDQFASAVRAFAAAGGKGLNITHPFKQQAWDLVDQYSERAARAKAVNTILCQPDGNLYGDNTDGVGLVRDLIQNLKWPLCGQKILLMGAGGAVRGVLGALLAESPAEITIVNRTFETAQQLAAEFSVKVCLWEEISSQSFDLIISGVVGGASLDPRLRGDDNWRAYDMNYVNQPSSFLQWASQNGALATANGLGMLIEQAAESFFLWRGIRPDTQSLKRILLCDAQ